MEKSFDFGALLQNHEKKHKSRPTQLVSVAAGVKKRLENSLKFRKSTRLTVFDKIRNLPNIESPVPEKKSQSKIEQRRLQLMKWKEDKDKKKKEASLNKKKPFIAGFVHNPLNYVPPPPPKPMPSTSGRVTRSQTARNKTNPITKQNYKPETKEIKKHQSFAPKNATFKPPVFKNMVKLPSMVSPKKNKENHHIEEILPNKEIKVKTAKQNLRKKENKTVKSQQTLTAETNLNKAKKASNSSKYLLSSSESSSSSASEEKPVKTRTPRKSIQKAELFTPENKKIPKSESSSEEKLRSPKQTSLSMTPEQIIEAAKKISPCVTLSRGKENARREMRKKIDEGLLDDDICEMESVDHFRVQLDSEIKRMTEMCETWEKISAQVPLPETVQELVLGAVGQARLLMAQKLQQFAALLARCGAHAPGALVTPADLHGFWDMVFMQIEDIDMRFKKLEELRSRGWVEEQPVVVKKRAAVRPPVSKPAATSRLKDMIAAARKAKKDQEMKTETEVQKEENKTFDAGFFTVRSPIKSPLGLSTPNKPTLLKAVLSSEAKKSISKLYQSSSYAMLRASLIGKNVDPDNTPVEDPVPLTPINLSATPARSILKSTKKSGKKSIKVVLFDNSDTEGISNDQQSDFIALDYQNDRNDSLPAGEVREEEKENKTRRRSKLIHQDAVEERSPVMTRSRRKSVSTPSSVQIENKRTSRRKKTLQEVELNEVQVTPRRSSRR